MHGQYFLDNGLITHAILTPAMSLAQINHLPLATLKLQLDHFHLAHGGNKKAIAKRLFDHLQTQQAHSDSEADSSQSLNQKGLQWGE